MRPGISVIAKQEIDCYPNKSALRIIYFIGTHAAVLPVYGDLLDIDHVYMQ